MMNQDKYLSLKQGLCMYNAMVLKHAIDINGQAVDIKQLAENLIQQLNSIQQDFSIPITLLERSICIGGTVALADHLRVIFHKVEHETRCTYGVQKLRELIYERPVFDDAVKLIEEQLLLDKEYMFTNPKQIVGKIIELVEEIFERLKASIRVSSVGDPSALIVNLLLVIELVNVLHVTDWYFDYANDNWGK